MRTARRLRRLTTVAGFGLMVAAISQEMAKPEAQRTWTGKVFGLVPYDFRPPTWDRIRAAYWNPNSSSLLSTRVLGVGWSINLYRASVLLENGFRMLMGTGAATPILRQAQKAATQATSKAQDVAASATGGRVGNRAAS
ncbi:MAG: hypothetical protein JF888_11130 [Candidatus Dormibacteraeota bacterium]|uniref:DUF5808 domain-containing protein n=1 Tax=Candidatus Dormiibacter inghamiae TaxID=3127013 RepID=A0A934KJ78_9BACT|nr:hypothetical protein [Candidatus Dormibacteraeota bacterium]MBJ7607249.1 hypothetical protein [Candidatus Dormibacteraeota bacterium]